MKTLGLIGGMSWESSTHYYQLLNRMVRDAYAARGQGGQHSAKLILWSVDFAPFAEKQAAGAWHELGAEMVDAARRLEDAGAEGLMICANTMHLLADEIEAAISIPLIHIADATAAALHAREVRRPILFATRFTMEKAFYVDRLARHGVEAIIPDGDDRVRLHSIIYDELIQGVFREESRQVLFDVFETERTARGADCVILGCTEFGMLTPPDTWDAPAFDTAEIHARAGVDFALAD